MKVLILAGGFGTRLSEYTNEIPKPMVPIGNIPIIVHIMSLYAKYGYKEFVVATGYKSNIINDYFKDKSKNIKTLSEIKVELEFQFNANNSSDIWKITLLYTGEKTMTGGRVKRAMTESGYPSRVSVLVCNSGCNGNVVQVRFHHDGFVGQSSDYGEPLQNLIAKYNEIFGDESYAQDSAKMSESLEENGRLIRHHEYLPELSSSW